MSRSTFTRYAWLILALFIATSVISGVRAADPASTTAAVPQGLFLHANVTAGKDLLSAVYDPVEQRLMQQANQYGALVPFANAMKNDGAEGLIPHDVAVTKRRSTRRSTRHSRISSRAPR